MAELKVKVPYVAKTQRGFHDVIQDTLPTSAPVRYVDPTQKVPKKVVG
jgi:hypothetical protein